MKSEIDYSVAIAGIEDIDDIIKICTNCFPFSFIWKAPVFLLRKKWTMYLNSGSVEVYIIRISNEIACFYELIVDMQLFQKLRKRDQNIDRLIKLSYPFTAITHPECIIPAMKKISKRIKFIFSKKQGNKIKSNIDITKVAWCELQGVHSRYRGIGLSKIMQRYALKRCEILGKEVLKSISDPNNLPMMKLYKSFNYVITGEGSYGCEVQKYLHNSEQP